MDGKKMTGIVRPRIRRKRTLVGSRGSEATDHPLPSTRACLQSRSLTV